MSQNSAALRILLSQRCADEIGQRIEQVLGTRPYELVSFEAALAQGRSDCDVAFISRDITGTSTKYVLTPAVQASYDLLRRQTALRWVHIHSAGADRPIYQELMQRGATLTNSSGANAEVVATAALLGLLALARRWPQLAAAQREHRWAPLLGADAPRDLAGQTALLVGWGPIGQRMGALVRALGLNLMVVRHQSAPSTDDVQMLSFEQLPSALPRADWLLLACPLTDKTRGLVNAQTLAALPRGAGLINVARGEVVVEADAISALRSGQLGSAYLDVFEHEPLLPQSPLWDMPNVMVTPHTAGHSAGNHLRVCQMFLDNLQRWCAQQALHHVVH